MPTFLDQAVNIFFQAGGGTTFAGTLFAIPIIFSIIIFLIRPIEI